MNNISVVIPAYNCQDLLEEAVHICANQSHPPHEIIIVDDNSSDKTLLKARLLSSKYTNLLVIPLLSNRGPGFARNVGVQNASNKLIAFLDVDDLWSPLHLYNLSQLYTLKPTCGLWISGYKHVFNELSDPVDQVFNTDPSYCYSTTIKQINLIQYLKLKINSQKVAWTSAVLVHKSIFLKVGGFPSEYHGEDQALWLKLVAHSDICKSSLITAVYCRHKSNLSSALVKDDAVLNQCIVSSKAIRSYTTKVLFAFLYLHFRIVHAKSSLMSKNYFLFFWHLCNAYKALSCLLP